MTLGNIITRVRQLTGETDANALSNAIVTDFVNDCIYEIAKQWSTVLLETTQDITLSDGTKTYALSSLTYRHRGILRMSIIDSTNKIVYSLDRITRDEMSESYTDLVTATDQEARPESYCIYGDTVYWVKTPNTTYTVRVDYRYIPTELSYTTGNETNIITDYASQVITAYATAEAYDYLQDHKRAEIWRSTYSRRLMSFLQAEGVAATEDLEEHVNFGSYR